MQLNLQTPNVVQPTMSKSQQQYNTQHSVDADTATIVAGIFKHSLPEQTEINQPRAGLTVDSLQMTFLPSSKSRDTKTKTNIKKPVRSNLDIVP